MPENDCGTPVCVSLSSLGSIPKPLTGESFRILVTEQTRDLIDNTDNLDGFVSHLCKFLGLASEAISCIVVVKHEEMREWAHHIQSLCGVSHGFTEDESYVAIGKCIPYTWPDGSVSSAILIPSYLLLQAIGNFRVTSCDGLDFQISADGSRPLQIIGHELGHARDYHCRKPPIADRVNENRFRTIREVGNYYGGILIEEFFACVHSVPLIVPDVAKECVKTVTERAEAVFVRAQSWEAVRVDSVQYAKRTGLVTMVQEALWAALLAEAEQIAYGSKNLITLKLGSAFPFPNLSATDRTEIGYALLIALMALMMGYPNVPHESAIEVLTDIWKTMCLRLNLMTEAEKNILQ